MSNERARPNIAILVTLDTKECEGYYLKERVESNGGRAFLIDLSMRKYVPKLGRPDVSNEEVAHAGGSSMEEVSSLDRSKAQEIMIKGARKILRELLARKELDGIVGLGGSTGLSLIASIMRELPMFIPKYIVTTVITEAGSLIAGSDIVPVWSISDLAGGERVNAIEAEVLNRVAAAVIGASRPIPYEFRQMPTIFATQFGNTTPHIIVAKDYLQKMGYDVIPFHALGKTGGYVMERLIESGLGIGVLDVTTHELVDEVAGGVLNASEENKLRLTAGGKRGIPQVVLPGAVDMINFWGPETVPEKFRSRCVYEHSRGLVTLIRATGEELYYVGSIMAKRLNHSRGPTAVIFPLRGFSIIDNDPQANPKYAPPGAYCQRMIYEEDGKIRFERTDTPWFDPQADRRLLKALLEQLDLSNENLDLIVVDYNINDPEVALLSARMLDDMIKGSWKKGNIPEVEGLDKEKIIKDPWKLI
ncbi:MAG: Tm-1-like ATP-binding domain-containing protein [Fervidicoccaceae archaeon]